MGLIPTELSSLQSLQMLQSIGNPDFKISGRGIAGMIGGGLLGWWLVNKFKGMQVPKYIGVIVGAEAGILLARLIKR